MSYAVVQTGGKQYRVQQGDILDVELLDAEVGSSIYLEDVRLIAGTDDIFVGSPNVAGAAVKAQVIEQVLGTKLVVFKYKAKTRYRRKSGHRQRYSRLKVDAILLPGAKEAANETMSEDSDKATKQTVAKRKPAAVRKTTTSPKSTSPKTRVRATKKEVKTDGA